MPKTIPVTHLNEEDITRTENDDVLYQGKAPDWWASYHDQDSRYKQNVGTQIMKATKAIVIFNDDEDQVDYIWCHPDDKAEITKPFRVSRHGCSLLIHGCSLLI
jgi:hypothetical protein